MKIEKTRSESNLYDIKISHENKILKILFAGNGDLYWCAYDLDNIDKEMVTFEITKENYDVYQLFEKLYDKIATCQVFKVSESDLNFCEGKDEIINLYKHAAKLNEELKQISNFTLLFHDGIISWHSDSTLFEDANVVNIKKVQDKIILEFIFYNKDLADENSIRFRNRGSAYKPFNVLFMELFNSLQTYDEEYHQIHLEEYLYQKRLEYK